MGDYLSYLHPLLRKHDIFCESKLAPEEKCLEIQNWFNSAPIQKNTLWCLVELFQSFETCVCLQTHDSRAVRMKKHDHETNLQQLTSPRILVVTKAIEVSMQTELF